jgi:hypothetical protein
VTFRRSSERSKQQCGGFPYAQPMTPAGDLLGEFVQGLALEGPLPLNLTDVRYNKDLAIAALA